jgi:hypothetical protein
MRRGINLVFHCTNGEAVVAGALCYRCVGAHACCLKLKLHGRLTGARALHNTHVHSTHKNAAEPLQPRTYR